MTAHSLMNSIVNSLDENSEKFYLEFDKTLTEGNYVLKNLGYKCGLRLSFDIANHALAHLSGTTFSEDVFSFDNVT